MEQIVDCIGVLKNLLFGFILKSFLNVFFVDIRELWWDFCVCLFIIVFLGRIYVFFYLGEIVVFCLKLLEEIVIVDICIS